MYVKYLTCLRTYDAWYAYDVIGVYKIHHGSGRISYFTELAILWLAGTIIDEVWAQHLTELAILWLASTVMGEVGARNRGGGQGGMSPWPRGQDHWLEKNIVLINQ